MSVGKYSPTVSHSYRVDQKWHEKNGGGFGNGKNPESDTDDEGYDSYGYSGDYGDGVDRAGYTEDEYLTTGEYIEAIDEMEYAIYERVAREWRDVLLGSDKVDNYPET